MASRWEKALNTALTLCAVAIAVSVSYRTFGAGASDVSQGSTREVKGWQKARELGWQSGPDTSRVELVVIEDLQCPVCRNFHESLKKLRATGNFGTRVQHVLYPLGYHKQALPAARIALCAEKLGRRTQWFDAVYQKQDSLGLRPWSSFAADAGISDTTLVNSCAEDLTGQPRIDASIEFARSMGATGTPTIIVNGYRLAAPPSAEELQRIVSQFAAGKNPFSWWTRLASWLS